MITFINTNRGQYCLERVPQEMGYIHWDWPHKLLVFVHLMFPPGGELNAHTLARIDATIGAVTAHQELIIRIHMHSYCTISTHMQERQTFPRETLCHIGEVLRHCVI